MNFSEFEQLKQEFNNNNLFGCDSSFANIFLYQEKYNTTLEIHNQILFRYNKNSDGTTFFSFPLPLKKAPQNFLVSSLEYIFSNFKRPFFQMITEAQKEMIDNCLKENFPTKKINWVSYREDTDYIYNQSDLSNLSGDILQKKKNHIKRFYKTYENRWEFKTYPETPILSDIMSVEKIWFKERNPTENADLQAEYKIIENAINNADFLQMSGGVLYVDGNPVAMTLASPISPSVLDIHFEKAIGEYVKNGAYAVINNLFAKSHSQFKYFNREEDLGIEGLRKAKMSYKPEILLHKFTGEIV